VYVKGNLCPYYFQLQELHRELRDSALTARSIEKLIALGQKHRLCPYYLTLSVVEKAKIVLVSYANLFNERLVDEIVKGDADRHIAVFDEAHNLPEFLEEPLARITYEAIKVAEAEFEAYMPNLFYRMKFIEDLFHKVCSHDRHIISLKELKEKLLRDNDILMLMEFCDLIEKSPHALIHPLIYLERPLVGLLEVREFARELLKSLNSNCRRVFLIHRGYEGHAISLLDLSHNRILGKEFWNRIFVSATLGDFRLFMRRIRLNEARTSTFSYAHFLRGDVVLLVDSKLSSEYRERNEELFKAIAGKIEGFLLTYPRSTGVFFSSYGVMEQVMRHLKLDSSGRPFFIEKRHMSLEEATSTIAKFKQLKERGAVIVGVQGGRFSEGEDFRENEMASIIIVGLALPPPSSLLFYKMREAKRLGVRETHLVYVLYPAISKMLQTIGRTVRGGEERKYVYVIDRRLLRKRTLELLPPWLKRNLIRKDFGTDDFRQILTH